MVKKLDLIYNVSQAEHQLPSAHTHTLKYAYDLPSKMFCMSLTQEVPYRMPSLSDAVRFTWLL